MDKQVGNVQLMQKMNRLKVLNFIRRNPSVARPYIAEQTGLSLSSITNIVTYLLDKNLVVETGREDVLRVGRKGVLLRFNGASHRLICVRVEMSAVDVAVTDLDGNIVIKGRERLESQNPEVIISTIIKEVKRLLDKQEFINVLAVGVAVSGLVIHNGRFVFSTSLKWNEISIKEQLEGSLNKPVFVENITFTKAVHWFFGSRMGGRNEIFVDLEEGIGAVILSGGSIIPSVPGEIGHTTVEKNGKPCFCGSRGCLEAMCSISRIVEHFREIGGDGDSFDDVVKAYKAGDGKAAAAIRECGTYLGIGLANLVNLFAPSIILLNAGEYLKCGEIIDIAAEEMRRRAYPVLSKDLRIKTVKMNLEDSVKGIALNLSDKIFDISCPYNIVE